MLTTNLQAFGHKVDLLCVLQTGGKISDEDAYAEIRALWKELKTQTVACLRSHLSLKHSWIQRGKPSKKTAGT
jgi:hypothetical protein